MKEHIIQLAEDYVSNLQLLDDEREADAFTDFTAGINKVLSHPEEFGLKPIEY